MKVLITRNDVRLLDDPKTLQLLTERIEKFAQKIRNHRSLLLNLTTAECMDTTMKAKVCSVTRERDELECCFTHSRRGNMQVTFLNTVGTKLEKKVYVMQPQYITVMHALILLCNHRDYLKERKGRRALNGAAMFIHRFVQKRTV